MRAFVFSILKNNSIKWCNFFLDNCRVDTEKSWWSDCSEEQQHSHNSLGPWSQSHLSLSTASVRDWQFDVQRRWSKWLPVQIHGEKLASGRLSQSRHPWQLWNDNGFVALRKLPATSLRRRQHESTWKCEAGVWFRRLEPRFGSDKLDTRQHEIRQNWQEGLIFNKTWLSGSSWPLAQGVDYARDQCHTAAVRFRYAKTELPTTATRRWSYEQVVRLVLVMVAISVWYVFSFALILSIFFILLCYSEMLAATNI